MKRDHILLEYARDNDIQVSEIGTCGPSCPYYQNVLCDPKESKNKSCTMVKYGKTFCIFQELYFH